MSINLVKRYLKCEEGATAIEYGLIAALIAVAIIGGANALSKAINNNFTCLRNVMAGWFVDDGIGPCKAFEKNG